MKDSLEEGKLDSRRDIRQAKLALNLGCIAKRLGTSGKPHGCFCLIPFKSVSGLGPSITNNI